MSNLALAQEVLRDIVMETITVNAKPVGLEKDLGIWLDILQVWRSHLVFLTIRLREMHQTHPDMIDGIGNDEVEMEMEYFNDSVLTDYLDLLQTELKVGEKDPEALSEAKWLQEYELIEEHMRELRSEYTKLLSRTLAALDW